VQMAKLNRNLALRQVHCPDGGRQTAARRQRLPNSRGAAGRAPSAKCQAMGCCWPARIPQRIGCMSHPGPATMGLAGGGSRIWGQGGLGRGDWMRRIGSGSAFAKPTTAPASISTSRRPGASHPPRCPSLPSCPTWWLFPKTGACSTSSGPQVTGRAAHTAASPPRIQGSDMDGWMDGWMDGSGRASGTRGPRPCADPDCSRPPEAVGYEGSTSSLSAQDRRPSLLPLTCLLSAPSPPQTPSPPSPRALAEHAVGERPGETKQPERAS